MKELSCFTFTRLSILPARNIATLVSTILNIAHYSRLAAGHFTLSTLQLKFRCDQVLLKERWRMSDLANSLSANLRCWLTLSPICMFAQGPAVSVCQSAGSHTCHEATCVPAFRPKVVARYTNTASVVADYTLVFSWSQQRRCHGLSLDLFVYDCSVSCQTLIRLRLGLVLLNRLIFFLLFF